MRADPSELSQSLHLVDAAPVQQNHHLPLVLSPLSLLYAHPLSYVLCHRTQPENLQHTQYLTVCAQHLYLEPFLLLSQDFSFLHLHVVRAKVLDNCSKKTIFVVQKSYNFDLSN